MSLGHFATSLGSGGDAQHISHQDVRVCLEPPAPDSTEGQTDRPCRERRGPEQCTPVLECQETAALG